jgi:hypothetical protein
MARPGYVHGLGLKNSSYSDASSEDSGPKKVLPETKQQLLHTTTNTSSIGPDTDGSRQYGDKTVYKHYYKSMGLFVAACSIFFGMMWGFFTNFPTICELQTLN